MTQYLEQFIPAVAQNGLNTLKAAIFGGGISVAGASTRTFTAAAVNTSATLTAAQVAGGYITTTSAAGVTMTMPTGTLLGAAVTAVRGMVLELYIDNTAGASTVTMAVGTNAVQSDWDNQITTATASVTPAAITPLTIASGTSGFARYTIMFASATAYVFSRTA